jgi:NitT/TauT family transport system ATP-binding protein
MSLPQSVTTRNRAEEPIIAVRGLRKSYPTPEGDKVVLGGIDIDVEAGRFVCIVGPSGAGKTTLLRCISGLLTPSAGAVYVEGEQVTRPPAKLAVVFQDYSRSLMPWMSVLSNVTLPLRSQRIPRAERTDRALAALTAVGLAGNESRYPWQLSGGMQQRVAIARALAYQPDALVMDEPFAAVDAQTRADLENLMLQVREEFNMTVLFVTHDIEEAVYLGDEVIVLSGVPAMVRRRIPVPLGRARDHLTTKSTREFVELRNEVLQLIQEARQGVSA